MRRQIKRVVATLLTASLIAPMCYGNKVSNAEMVKKNVTATAVDEDGSDGLTEITELHAASVDNKIEVRIWKNEEGKIFYSAYRNGHVTLKCVPLGIVAKSVDLSTGLQVDEESYELKKGKEEYDWYQGSKKHVNKEYQEMSFVVTKENAKMQVIFRIFEDGIGFRYVVDGDTTTQNEKTVITSEVSSFEFPMDGRVWNADWYSSTYEPGSYSTRTMTQVKNANGDVPPAILSQVANGNGSCYMLLTEANVYNEEKPYCATIFHTNQGSAAYKVQFSKYLKQEQDPEYVGKTFKAEYLPIESVTMENENVRSGEKTGSA